MLVTPFDHPCIGAEIRGRVMAPHEDNCVYAIYHLQNTACGAYVILGQHGPYLRLLPAVQIPKEARAGFERFVFEHEDEAMVDLLIDTRDGEVSMRVSLDSAEPAVVEKALDEHLAWIDRVAYPAIMEYLDGIYLPR